ncbi:MAG TPA: hypothetical protein VFQ61_06320 [Polyangiaceae bacterium]|nr:hypothetical protein [Polyangiaceae bacterium]
MVDFFRQLRHLLPDSVLWRPKDVAEPDWQIGDEHTIGEPGLTIGPHATTRGLQLWRMLKALATVPERAVDFIDGVFADLMPDTTRQLSEWEQQFGILPEGEEADRRLQVAAAWPPAAGLDPYSLQVLLQAAGFPLYVHEWWTAPGPPWTERDPRLLTEVPIAGSVRCRAASENGPRCTSQHRYRCDGFLVNEPGYLVNLDLTRRAPPAIPDTPSSWRGIFYVGAETFPGRALVPASRRRALERLVLANRPQQYWVVMLVQYY